MAKKHRPSPKRGSLQTSAGSGMGEMTLRGCCMLGRGLLGTGPAQLWHLWDRGTAGTDPGAAAPEPRSAPGTAGAAAELPGDTGDLGDPACRGKQRETQVRVVEGGSHLICVWSQTINASAERARLGCIHGLYLCFPSWNLHFSLFCCNSSALRTGPGGTRQLPVPSHGWRLRFAPEQNNKCMHLGFFKSIKGSDSFVLPSKSLLPPHGSSPALQAAPSAFLHWSNAGGRAPCHRAAAAPERHGSDNRAGPFICRAMESLFLKPSENFPGCGDPS